VVRTCLALMCARHATHIPSGEWLAFLPAGACDVCVRCVCVRCACVRRVRGSTTYGSESRNSACCCNTPTSIGKSEGNFGSMIVNGWACSWRDREVCVRACVRACVCVCVGGVNGELTARDGHNQQNRCPQRSTAHQESMHTHTPLTWAAESRSHISLISPVKMKVRSDPMGTVAVINLCVESDVIPLGGWRMSATR
jgi:hypothetical protein